MIHEQASDPNERTKGDMTDKQDIQVHEGRRTGVVVSVRLKPHEADLLEALARRDGRTLSETLRIALHTLATSPGAGRNMALQGEELSPVTRGEWDQRRVELEPA
jgi:Ribbon-helix-helix protein, copG family